MMRNIRKYASCRDALLAEVVNYDLNRKATAREGAAALARFRTKSKPPNKSCSLFTIEQLHR
jgi:hypothetical protein